MSRKKRKLKRLRAPFRFGLKRPRFKFNPIKRDPFGNIILLKRILIAALATVTYGRINIVNRLKVEGTVHLKSLPSKGVLFVSNHQTYFADVIAFYHIFCSVKWKFKDSVNLPVYMLLPKVNLFYIAAEETMKSGLIPKIFSYTGAVLVRRSWRAGGKNVSRGADIKAPQKIKRALEHGWVVNFPQGTTSPYAPVRKGTAHVIKNYKPVVVPIVIDGFRRAFDKRGLYLKKTGTQLSVKFKAPLKISEDATLDEINEMVALAIEQKNEPKEVKARETKKEA